MGKAVHSTILLCRISHGRIGRVDDHALGTSGGIALCGLGIVAGTAEEYEPYRRRTQGDEENAKDAEPQDQDVKAAGRPGITRFAKDVRIGKHHGSSLNVRMRT